MRTSLDIYDERPPEMTKYLQYNGWHFNKKMCEFAISQMRKGGKPLEMHTKEQIDKLLKNANVTLDNNQLYDYVYVANMCKADFLGKSIPNEVYMAKYIKDVIDDEDGYDGLVFNRWYADTVKKGIAIDWYEML